MGVHHFLFVKSKRQAQPKLATIFLISKRI